jgi:hypothetical protein
MAVCLTSMSTMIGPSDNAPTTACDGLLALRKVNVRKENVKPTWQKYFWRSSKVTKIAVE